MPWQVILKTAITVAVIVVVSEIASRPKLGALIVALPFTSLLVMIWMHVEGNSAQRIAQHSRSTFWYVLPTLPMFLLLPRLLEAKWNFYVSLVACCVLTTGLFLAGEWIGRKWTTPKAKAGSPAELGAQPPSDPPSR